MPTKYGITYTISNGRAIIQANASLRLPKITIHKYTTSRNLDYVLRVLGNEVSKMPITKAAFGSLYDRGMEGTITFTMAKGLVGDMRTNNASGQTGASAVQDRGPGVSDFDMTISVPSVKGLANFYKQAKSGTIKGTGLTAGEIAQIRGRDNTLDALIYLFGHEVGGHIGRANREGLKHNSPESFGGVFDDAAYEAGFSDSYAAGVPTFKTYQGSSYYLGDLAADDYFDYKTQSARVQYGSGHSRSNNAPGLNLAPILQTEPALDLSTDPSIASGTIGQILGSSLARFIGGGTIEQLVSSSLLGALGQNVAQFISAGGIGSNAATARGAFERSFGDFSQDLKVQLQNAALGTVSSFLALELGNALGIKGFGAELVTTGASSVFNQVLSNAASIASTPVGQAPPSLFAGLDGKGLFGKDLVGQGSNIGLVNTAFASFFGAKLGSLILAPTNTQGAVLSSIGASLGAWAFGAGAASAGTIGSIGAAVAGAFQGIGNFVAPFVGSLVGFLLGSLVGRLFGRKKPRVPSASAEALLSVGAQEWTLGQVTSANGGSRDAVTEAARLTADTINGTLSLATGERGKIIAVSSLIEKVGHTGQTIYLDKITNGVTTRLYSGSDISKAAEVGAIDGIRSTRIYGGDLFVKRAIAASQASDLVELMGDIQTATDYGLYLANRRDINTLISQAPTSEFALTWAVTLQRASELGLTSFQQSDFQGGLGGMLSSLGFGRTAGSGNVGFGFETLQLSDEGGALRVATTNASAPFDLFAWSNNTANPDRSLLIPSFLASAGYTAWNGQATAGNDFWIASGGGPVTMDDSGYVEEWRWNPWDYTYEPYYTYVSGGDDLFVGSSHADALYGREGLDWLDGGDGNDLVEGGGNDDVVLGGSGNDRLLGNSGDDYIAGGEGNDYFYDTSQTWGLYGGDGNDILVGGAGTDSLYGENGDDVFIVDQDGGNTWDALTGQGGSDTLSYERFNSGVYIDFGVLGGWSWDPTAKYIYGDAIAGTMENVTGSQFGDTLLGDAAGNILKGLAGDDYLYGRDGDDVLDGGLGADGLDGGNGSDTASYEFAKQGVSVDLTSMVATNGDAQDDRFTSIENLRGSQFADDLTGDAGANTLSGLGGDDFFTMTAGGDVIDGGEGHDTLDGSMSGSGLTVYYDAGYYDPYYGYYPGAGWVAASSAFGTSTLSSFEGFIGSDYNDSFGGSDADETFRAGVGNDTLSGGNGSDTYVYQLGDGYDTIYDTAGGANTIAIDEPELRWSDLYVQGADYRYQGSTLTVGSRTAGSFMAVSGNFSYVNSGSSAGNHNHVIKNLTLAGSEVDISAIDWTPYAADDNATVVYGAQNRSDLIFAYGGDDTIYTAGGGYETRGNVVYAGDGNDTIIASAGDDQYIFERGNGIDTLHDAGGADTIVMGPSVDEDDVIYEVVASGGSADLYIGIRDANNPAATASQVADRIRVVGGGMKYIGMYYGNERLNTIEHVRVGGQEIDLTKANINWAIGYEDDGGYYGGGGGGGGGGGYNIPPLAIDLDGDGIELRSVEGSRIASIDADGTVTRMGWLGQDDGFLALDRDGNGVIDRIGEISFAGDVKGARTDLEGLAAYDSNGDGKLDASDKRWGEFKVWQDKNQDGFGAANELVGLDKAGITSISLKGTLTGFSGAGTDGFDNTVIATTEIGWADKTRTGSGYDVLLARLQVRTDGGVKDGALADALARGAKVDDIAALLHGVQSLTEEQVKALREKKAQGAKATGEGGLLYRIEDLLGGSTKLVGGAAAKTADGLLAIDPALVQKVVAGSRALGLIDRYAGSDWTTLGSITPGEADMRGVVTTVEKRDLSVEQKAVIADARKIVAERKLADEAKAAALVAKDAADSVLRPAPTPPTAAELERLKQTDKFRLLEGKTGDAADRDIADIDADAIERDLMRQFAAAAAPDVSQDAPADPVTEDTAEASEAEAAPTAADADASPARSASAGDVAQDNAALPDLEAYGVVIRTANARLVQALASFGDAPAMMARYQGLDVANDAQAAWLSVDAMPSVQRLAAIR